MTLKIGTIGCSRVAEKYFFPHINSSENADIEFVGSRSIKKAEEWAKKYGSNKFGDYTDVINSNVDVVYISLPIALHEEWAIKAANAGKHVLCEKSSSISYQSAKKMLQACKDNNVRILEALAFRFHPQHKQIQNLINEELGDIQNFYGIFGFPPPPENDIRWKKELGGGILNDVTCYPICASRIIFQSEPISVLAHLEFDKKFQVDKSADVFLKYEDGKTAFGSSGFNNYYQSKYDVWGSDAKISTKRTYAVPQNYETSIYLHKDDKIFETVIVLSSSGSVFVTSFILITSERSERKSNSAGDILEKQYGL